MAADDQEVLDAVQRCGGRAILTRTDHTSGTDRVAEVAERPDYRDHEFIVNLQGDELFLPPAAVAEALERVRAGWHIGTAAVPIVSEAEWRDPSVVKVVCDDQGAALYFSRAPIPHGLDGGVPPAELEGGQALRHIGIYAFTRAALRRAVALPRHRLEESEGLEQLRWLAGGLRIGVALVEGGAPGIDTEEDVERAEDMLRERREIQ